MNKRAKRPAELWVRAALDFIVLEYICVLRIQCVDTCTLYKAYIKGALDIIFNCQAQVPVQKPIVQLPAVQLEILDTRSAIKINVYIFFV